MCYLLTKYVWIFALVCANYIARNQCEKWGSLTYCSTLTYSSKDELFKRDNCRHIDELTNGDIQCVFEVDRLRCLERLLGNTADFGVFNAEDIFLAPLINNSGSENLVITNELRQSANQSYEFDMVVLVNNGIPIKSLSDLKGRRLCHPGFDERSWLYDWSEIFSQYFEETVVPEQCDSSLSVFENKVKSLSSFFASACKAGRWSPDPLVDETLKSKYSQLCANCKIQATCSRNDQYWGRQGPLSCLTDCSGDVTWVRQQDIDIHFQLVSKSLASPQLCLDVSFLCPDGTKQPLNASHPCVWLSRPWPVIIAQRAAHERVSSLIRHMSTPEILLDDSWEYKLRVLLTNSLQPIHSVAPNNLTPLQYLRKVPGFLNANTMRTCKGTGDDKVIVVCTENDLTKKKCDLMSLVARVYSVDPEFRCIVTDDCVKSVAEGKSDTVIISTVNLKHAYERHDLKTILYQTSIYNDELRFISAVVRRDSKINVLKQLRGKKACFSEVGGLGWNSLLMILKENSLIDDYCDEKSAISNFFSEVCIIDSKPDDGFQSCFFDDFEKLDVGSVDLNEAQGLKCIATGGGDVAFINFYSIDKYLRPEYKNRGWFDSSLRSRDFKQICPYKNSTSHDCYLSRSSFGQILVRQNLSNSRVEEITSAFLILNSLLVGNNNRNSIFKIFTHYQNEKNILFESQASRLERTEDFSNRIEAANNLYELKLADMVRVCQERKKHNYVKGTASSLISISVIYFLLPSTYLTIHVFDLFYN